MRIRELRRRVRIPLPVSEVFGFFSRAENLDRITPPWLHFRILTPQPVSMERGAKINYKLRLKGIPLRWDSEITAWDPPHEFIDRQIRGPYLFWEHRHSFSSHGNETLMEDIVRYAVPGFIFEPVIHFLFVRYRLEKIFDYREEALSKALMRSLNSS